MLAKLDREGLQLQSGTAFCLCLPHDVCLSEVFGVWEGFGPLCQRCAAASCTWLFFLSPLESEVCAAIALTVAPTNLPSSNWRIFSFLWLTISRLPLTDFGSCYCLHNERAAVWWLSMRRCHIDTLTNFLPPPTVFFMSYSNWICYSDWTVLRLVQSRQKIVSRRKNYWCKLLWRRQRLRRNEMPEHHVW